MDKPPTAVGQAIRRIWSNDVQRMKAEAFDEIKRILANAKKKPGPQGSRKSVQSRRLVITTLWGGGFRKLQLCAELQQHRIFLPSRKLRSIYTDYGWKMWFQTNPNAVYRQIDSDLNPQRRKRPTPLNS